MHIRTPSFFFAHRGKTPNAVKQAKLEWDIMRANQRSAREALKLMEENGT